MIERKNRVGKALDRRAPGKVKVREAEDMIASDLPTEKEAFEGSVRIQKPGYLLGSTVGI